MRFRLLLLAGFAALSGAAGAAPKWSASDLAALRDVVAAAPAEGVAGYDAAPLETLVPGDLSDAVADVVALELARDYREGTDAIRADRSWHFAQPAFDYPAWLNAALARHGLKASFAALLPASARYRALREALAGCGQPAPCRQIAINLDRLRALPHELGNRYLWVNVPAFRLDLVEDGKVVASHRIIVGKPGSQTPSFQTKVIGVTINPWWNVPCSIVDESIGKLVTSNPREAARRGYVASRDAKGKLAVRQRPGPDNALGRIKLEMPNPYNVYIHDTPSKDLFANQRRAFSHGCIRTQDPQSLALSILGDGQAQTIELLLETGVSRTLRLPRPLPVYVVYMTTEPGEGGQLLSYPDLYRRDRR